MLMIRGWRYAGRIKDADCRYRNPCTGRTGIYAGGIFCSQGGALPVGCGRYSAGGK